MSPAEQIFYSEVKLKGTQSMNSSVLLPTQQKRQHVGIFQLHLQLRRLCNHGTFQRAAERSEDFDAQHALMYLRNQKLATCERCGCKVGNLAEGESRGNGRFTVCGHLLCLKCAPDVENGSRQTTGDSIGRYLCLICHHTSSGSYWIDGSHSEGSRRNAKRIYVWDYFDRNGHSTKVAALLQDIREYQALDEKRYVKYCLKIVFPANICSIVFSCWTRTLDLIACYLHSSNISYCRIDGTQSAMQREQILKEYQQDTSAKILLMTTGTGAFGYVFRQLKDVTIDWRQFADKMSSLNLTVANRVYIMEPQWNPMVESQAIGRVLRLGQTKDVHVVRYIMKGSVEEASWSR